MYFRVLDHGVRPAADAKDRAYLLTDNWDDWFKYNTMYTLVVYDEDGERHQIGSVKIGQFEMEEGQRRAAIPKNLMHSTNDSSRSGKTTATTRS